MGKKPTLLAAEAPALAETLLREALGEYNRFAPVFLNLPDSYTPVLMLAVPLEGVEEFSEGESNWSIWVGTMVAGRLRMAGVFFPEAQAFYQVAHESKPSSHNGAFEIKFVPMHETLVAEIGEARFPADSVPTVPTTVQALSTGQALSNLIGGNISLAISPKDTVATLLAAHIVKMAGGAVVEVDEGTVWGSKQAVAQFVEQSKK
ncbi:MAG: hypothetical protein IT290_08785 [Deltaproteobacteria bacterium]|nr:hypothetical protein [Deltaproteobacteria bacterium]